MEDIYEKYMHTRGSELVYMDGWMDERRKNEKPKSRCTFQRKTTSTV